MLNHLFSIAICNLWYVVFSAYLLLCSFQLNLLQNYDFFGNRTRKIKKTFVFVKKITFVNEQGGNCNYLVHHLALPRAKREITFFMRYVI